MSRFHSWGVCRLCSSQQKWRIFPFVSLSLSFSLSSFPEMPHAFPCNQPAPTLYKEDSVPFSNCVIPSAADIYSRRGFPAIDIIIPKFPFFTVCKLLHEKRKRHLFFFSLQSFVQIIVIPADDLLYTAALLSLQAVYMFITRLANKSSSILCFVDVFRRKMFTSAQREREKLWRNISSLHRPFGVLYIHIEALGHNDLYKRLEGMKQRSIKCTG